MTSSKASQSVPASPYSGAPLNVVRSGANVETNLQPVPSSNTTIANSTICNDDFPGHFWPTPVYSIASVYLGGLALILVLRLLHDALNKLLASEPLFLRRFLPNLRSRPRMHSQPELADGVHFR